MSVKFLILNYLKSAYKLDESSVKKDHVQNVKFGMYSLRRYVKSNI